MNVAVYGSGKSEMPEIGIPVGLVLFAGEVILKLRIISAKNTNKQDFASDSPGQRLLPEMQKISFYLDFNTIIRKYFVIT